MHRRSLIGLALAGAALGAAAPSFAQPREEGRGGPPAREQRDHRDDRERHEPRQAQRGRGDWEREMRAPEHYGARGPEWHRGGHIPPEYRNRMYVVNDWRLHHLAPPPRGYEWVQVGPDYVLVAIRTGVIFQIVLG
ncbi:MAG: RcnB family protein [Ramlibacter sp.]